MFISTYALAGSHSVNKQAYLDSIYKKVYSELYLWEAQKGTSCEVVITQDRQGNILNSSIDNCTIDDEYFIKQLKRAVKKSSPLPKAPAGLFSENIVINPIVKKDIDIGKMIVNEAKKGNDKANKVLRLVREELYSERSYSEEIMEMYKNNDSRAIEIYNNIGKSLNIKSK